MRKTKLAHFSLIIAVGLVVTLAVILYGFPFGSHDGVSHVLWYKHLADQLWGGSFLFPLVGKYERWTG